MSTKKILRPSPSEHAKDYKDKIKLGNDGLKYKSVKDINNVYRWKKVQNSKCQKYYTENNGVQLYLIEDYKDKIIVYNNETKMKILETKYQEIYFGKVPSKILNDSIYSYKKGNTILFLIKPNKYIFIGDDIISFRTKDKILKFISPIGNSDVPYPYAIGEKYTYLLVYSGHNKYQYIENKLINIKEIVYEQIYEYDWIILELKNSKKITIKKKEELKEKLKNAKIIHDSVKHLQTTKLY